MKTVAVLLVLVAMTYADPCKDKRSSTACLDKRAFLDTVADAVSGAADKVTDVIQSWFSTIVSIGEKISGTIDNVMKTAKSFFFDLFTKLKGKFTTAEDLEGM